MHTITKSNEDIYRKSFENVCKTINAETFLDIGSYDGYYSVKLGKLVHAKKIICVDHDRTALKLARKRGCQTIIANINEKIPVRSNSVDLITCNQVIEHVVKTDILIKEVRRILKPNGISLWCTPNLASWHNIVALMFGYQPFSSQVSDISFIGNPWHNDYNKKINEDQAHLRIFTRRSLRDILQLHHLNIKKEQGVGYYFPIPLISKFLCIVDPLHAAYLFTIAIKTK